LLPSLSPPAAGPKEESLRSSRRCLRRRRRREHPGNLRTSPDLNPPHFSGAMQLYPVQLVLLVSHFFHAPQSPPRPYAFCGRWFFLETLEKASRIP